MRRPTSLLFLFAVCTPSLLAGQVGWGVHLAKANETTGGAWGGGAHVSVDAPALPVGLVLAGDYFNAECDDCSFLGWSLDARMSLLFPVVDPYGTAGLVGRKFDPGNDQDGEWQTSLAVGGGVAVPIASSRVFSEIRYEFVDNDQIVWRFGIGF